MTDCRREFPASWFKHAKFSKNGHRASLNYFGVNGIAAHRGLAKETLDLS